MAKDIPDYMREFDTSEDWGFTPVSSKPSDKPSIDPKVVEGTNIELSKVKSDVGDIKSMMNEIMQIVAEKDTITKEISDEDIDSRIAEMFSNAEQEIPESSQNAQMRDYLSRSLLMEETMKKLENIASGGSSEENPKKEINDVSSEDTNKDEESESVEGEVND